MKRAFAIFFLALSGYMQVYSTDYVVISEVMYDTPLNQNIHTPPHDYGEFIELYNAGFERVDLSGWTISTDSPSQTYTIPQGTILDAREFLVIAYLIPFAYGRYDATNPSWTNFHELYQASLDAHLDKDEDGVYSLNLIFQQDLYLPNTQTSLALRDNTGLLKDSVAYACPNYAGLVAENDYTTDFDNFYDAQIASIRRFRATFNADGTAYFGPWEWMGNGRDQDPSFGTVQTVGYSECTIRVENFTDIQTASAPSVNYIRRVTPYVEMSVVPSDNAFLTGRAVLQYDYFDAMCRPEQTIYYNATGGGKNLVNRIEYDGFSRKKREYLPIVVDSPLVYFDDYAFSVQSHEYYPSESRPYIEYGYSDNVLPGDVTINELLSVQQAGSDMRGHKDQQRKSGNPASTIKRFRVSSNGTLWRDGFYEQNTLSCDSTADADGHLMQIYKNRSGQVVLSRQASNADTYYVYNDLGQLTYVLPPNAAPFLSGTSIPETNDYILKYCYVYKYDSRGRCTYKRIPGCEPICYLYDDADRMVLSQTGNQAENQTATQYTYDLWGRILATDERTVGRSFPTSLSEVGDLVQPLTRYYYDYYDFISSSRPDLNYQAEEGFTADCLSVVKGQPTGQVVYSLGKADEPLATTFFYDNRYRLIQQRSENCLGGMDISFTEYGFSPNPVRKYSRHSTNNSSLSEKYIYSYDNQNRQTGTRYQLNDEPIMLLDSIAYDDLGRISKKIIYNGIDSVEFSYNIRNQLTQLQSAEFAENLYYTSVPAQLHPSGMGCYNGNVAAITWSNGSQTNGYSYHYDNMNRLSLADGVVRGNYYDYLYNESFVYDKQGNITSIIRWDNNDIMNALSMTYSGNQLKKVTDNGFAPFDYDEKRYHDGSNEQNEFFYDANGNLIADLDRKICTIRYNVLNLPDTIQFTNGNQIVHSYDALGKRLLTTYYTRRHNLVEPATSTLPGTVTNDPQQYSMVSYADVGNKRYKKYGTTEWQVDYVFNPEGYIRFYGAGDRVPFYYIKDHLGNVREVYVNPGPGYKLCAQRTQYYPSGLPWNETYFPSEQPFKYNGKEFIEMHGLDEYDSEARWYYPAIMRTTTMDPLCEKYYSTSPYAWCGNNPVNLIDPDGRDTVRVGYNIEVGQWEISSHVISEGDDLLIITNANGEEQLCAFNEGEYGNRICSVRLGGSDIQTFGVFFLSGCDVAGFFVEPAGEPNNDAVNQQPLELGVYDISKNTGDKWTGWPRQGNAGFPKERAACIHYAGNHGKDYALRNQNLSAVLWTTKCMVVATNYSKRRDGTVIFNSIDSFNTAKSVARYCGATKFNMRTKSNGNGNYYICSGWTNSTVQRIIKSR